MATYYDHNEKTISLWAWDERHLTVPYFELKNAWIFTSQISDVTFHPIIISLLSKRVNTYLFEESVTDLRRQVLAEITIQLINIARCDVKQWFLNSWHMMIFMSETPRSFCKRLNVTRILWTINFSEETSASLYASNNETMYMYFMCSTHRNITRPCNDKNVSSIKNTWTKLNC
jgi:hypothetical protein